MTRILFKTDKNGTKWYKDDTCTRCGGSGYIKTYEYVEGGICFKCQGCGFGDVRIVKEYTPEYQAILTARRIARLDKKEAEFKAHIADHYKELGLAENGHAFAVLAKTFGRKDELKAAGARYNGAWWYFSHAEEAWDTTEIDSVPMLEIDPQAGVCKWDESLTATLGRRVVDKILADRRIAANVASGSEFYGSEGDKVQAEVTITGLFSFVVDDPFSYDGGTKTMYGYKMRDAENHCFVWLTGSRCHADLAQCVTGDDMVEDEAGNRVSLYGHPELVRKTLIGRKFVVKGTVKGHQEREGLKETKLTRCKFTLAA